MIIAWLSLQASKPNPLQLCIQHPIDNVQEMFERFGRTADAEAEHIVPLLAKKAGEVSVAGRENFLATEAEAALASMVENLSESKVGSAFHDL